MIIIESVDPICTDMIIQKISQNLKNGKLILISLYDNVPFIFEYFMTYNTPSVA